MTGDDEAPIDSAQLDELREALERLREEIELSLTASKGDAQPVGLDLAIGRLTRVDALQQQHMAAERRRRLEVQLAQVRQALSKLAAGTYGDCPRCGEPIGLARLRARPEAPFCVRCQGGRAPA